MKVNVFQVTRDVKRLGKRNCPWSIEWRDPETGRRRTKTVGAKKNADELATAMEAKHNKAAVLDADQTDAERQRKADEQRAWEKRQVSWAEFEAKYKAVKLFRSLRSSEEAGRTLKRFGEYMKPERPECVTTAMLQEYVAKRLKDRGAKPGETLSRQTASKEIRTILAALSFATEKMQLIERVPNEPDLDVFETDKRHVEPEHFDAMLKVLDSKPETVSYPFCGDYGNSEWTAAEWWIALLVLLWTTGMRIGAVLALRWDDVDLSAGIVRSRARNAKPGKYQLIGINLVLPLLLKIKGDDPLLLPWKHADTHLAKVYGQIQDAAGINMPCIRESEHECTPACHRYCFHDFRRAFATENFGNLTKDQLQELMGHASFSTTERYIDYSKQHQRPTVEVAVTKVARAIAQGLRVADIEHDGGQAADIAGSRTETQADSFVASA